LIGAGLKNGTLDIWERSGNKNDGAVELYCGIMKSSKNEHLHWIDRCSYIYLVRARTIYRHCIYVGCAYSDNIMSLILPSTHVH
jgi:hypothetical protein